MTASALTSPERVYLSDTTLRDGEQAPGCGMSVEGKLAVGLQLERLGVDRIEVGFPAASDCEMAAAKMLSAQIRHSEVMAFARATRNDIRAAARALEKAVNPVIHTFVPGSDLHLQTKVGWSREQALEYGEQAIEFALRYVDTVQFAVEDATRSDVSFVADLGAMAVRCGAQTFNVADTVGYILPTEFSAMIRKIFELAPSLHDIVFSVHCHDDLGLAMANSLAALQSGARQIEGTINGIGERAGNVALEEVVMMLDTRPSLNMVTAVKTEQICRTSQVVSHASTCPVPPNKAIVGSNAFAHEAGIHQDGMLKNPLTYEIMTPESVGQLRSLVLGKHSGRAGLQERLRGLDQEVDGGMLDKLYSVFLSTVTSQPVFEDRDLLTLLHQVRNLERATVAPQGQGILPKADSNRSLPFPNHQSETNP